MAQELELGAMRQVKNEPPPTYNTIDPHAIRRPVSDEGHENLAYDKMRGDEVRDSKLDVDDVTAEGYVPEPLDDEEEEDQNCCLRYVKVVQARLQAWWTKHKRVCGICFGILCLLLYAAYFIYAMYYGRLEDEGDVRLLWVTVVVVVFAAVYQLFNWTRFSDGVAHLKEMLDPYNEAISWVIVGLLYLFLILFVLFDVFLMNKEPYNLVSLAGLVLFVLIFFIFSYNPAKVRWRPVVWGIGLQFILALITLRTHWGYVTFKWLGDRVTEFLTHTDAGSVFVFGDKYTDHKFAFQVLPIVIFFSSMITVLFYLGAMQAIIKAVAWVMQVVMATTAGESMNAAGNIFIGQSEAPLMIRPLINDMTKSELHAVMTGGFATIAGSVLAAYIRFDVPANHLITASVMSAPAALAMSKLFYPETEISKTKATDLKDMAKCEQKNVIEAASYGATQATKLVAYIAANLIAFIAILAFVDATLIWLGMRVGIENLTFETICSYLLWPIALVMGVHWTDCRRVAALLGVKTFINEFVAYQKLGTIINNRVAYDNHTLYNGSYSNVGDDIRLYDAAVLGRDGLYSVQNVTLAGGIMTERSEVITAYALCGFANFGSIGIMLGGLGAMAPKRKRVLASIVFRAMIAGNVACFMTACIAGLLYRGEY